VQYQLTGLLGQGSTGGPEQEDGPAVVPAGVLQDAVQQQPVQLPVGLRVQVAGVGAEPLAEPRSRSSASGAISCTSRPQLPAEAAQIVLHQQR
jgi:hypothetical protein